MAFGLNLLQMVQEFCKRTNLPVPSTAANSTDPGVRQYVGLLNEEIEACLLKLEWQELLQQCTFTTLGVSDQGLVDTLCGFPAAFVLNDILWDTDTRLPIFGPVGPQRWEQYKALPITGTLLQYRIQNDHLLLYPLTPPVGHTVIFEAMQKYAVVAEPGPPVQYKQYFTADADLCSFKDDHMIAGLRWRWKREKGLAYAEDKDRYTEIIDDRKLRNATARILNMNGSEENFGPGILVPSGSWNVHGGGIPGGAWDSSLGP